MRAHIDESGCTVLYESPAIRVEDYDTDSPRIIYEQNGEQKELVCDFVAGCDGFHGVARKSVPATNI
jgi:p-hydroxybenzoate 3-monooxygenase